MSSTETLYVDSKTVACNGGVGHLGHPRVFLNMGPATEITCPYCSRHFVFEKRSAVPAPGATHSA